MKIILHDNSLNLRGTSVALYDYAFHLKKLYNHECAIAYDVNHATNDQKVIKKFKREFEVFGYSNFTDINAFIQNIQADIYYATKAGERDGKNPLNIKTCVHAVFPCGSEHIHGDVYAFISPWLSQHCSNNTTPFVPYMVNLPNTTEHYRTQLSIPKHAIVFGRYGGIETFDINFVYQVINDIVKTNANIYFLFCNTYKFINHPNVIFANNTASLLEKVKFINTCDALLHARHRGETFGLAIAEFMSKGKPVFTYSGSAEKNHYLLLDNQGVLYDNSEDLYCKINEFVPHSVSYRQNYTLEPTHVMQKFQTIFL
jgi:hypothetical protein